MRECFSIVVAGGGTAGWLCAALLAADHQDRIRSGELSIRLCESPTIAAIGVGEGSWPTLRTTLARIGLSETEFLRHCDASFKQGSQFVNWCGTEQADVYYHPFQVPMGAPSEHWARFCVDESRWSDFAALSGPQPLMCARHLAPKSISSPEYAGELNYGYHFDSEKLISLLRSHCCNALGVQRTEDDIVNVALGDDGGIDHIDLAVNGELRGDLYVDCTGFRSLLLGQALDVPVKPVRDVLLNDAAIVCHLPYSEDEAIASCTLSTAQEAGWIWDVGLASRRGLGYVYASEYQTEHEARQCLLDYIQASSKADVHSLKLRALRFTPGYRETLWRHNCVAVGLSAGFVEPLEASSLVLTELAARFLSENLPVEPALTNIVAGKFNRLFAYHWQRVVDFLKLHYVLSGRTGAYWDAQREPESVPDTLAELLSLWRYRLPTNADLGAYAEVFSAVSYHYILAGMTAPPATKWMAAEPLNDDYMRSLLERNQQVGGELGRVLTSNRELLNKVKRYGFSKV